MFTRRMWAPPLLAGLLAVSLSTADAAAAAAAPQAARPDPAHAVSATPDSRAVVTLLSGDRVVVTGGRQVTAMPGAGRGHVRFMTYRADRYQYVIPSDALPLLSAGRLDRRLFNVTLLAEYGYHDARADLPVIVAGGTGVSTLAAPAGVEVAHPLPAVDGAALRVDKAAATGFWADLTGDPGQTGRSGTLAAADTTVWLDGVRQPALDRSVPQVGAPAAYDLGLDGTGVTVAVLDTGIDADHPDFAGRIAARENFTEGEEDDRDLVGHGTHVASIVAGSGAASGGRFAGVAPGADLLDAKVCVESGCLESWIIAGMQWAYEQGAAVANLSLGVPPPPDDPVEAAVNRLTDEFGILFAVAAGNFGPEPGSVESPATADAAIAVGAVERDDQIAGFSARGPRADGALKPDLTAPGVGIVAANSSDGLLGEPGEPYTTLSGTSMAAPHVAGAAAILAQQHPDWSPAALKAALMGSAAPRSGATATDQGAGRLDVARAVTQPVTASPPSVSFARQQWPHDDDEPESATVTYRNHGDEDVTLTLALAATGPDGNPAPVGMFTLDRDTVVVAAGGTAAISVTSDTSVEAAGGLYLGRLVATGGEVVVQIPLIVDREVESYDVTFAHRDRTGAATGAYLTTLASLDGSRVIDLVGGEPDPTVRVPAGEYMLCSLIHTDGKQEASSTMLCQLHLQVTGELETALDARTGRPITLSVPDPAAELLSLTVRADVPSAAEMGLAASQEIMPVSVYTAQLVPGERLPGAVTSVRGEFVVPDGDGSFLAPPRVYHLAYLVDDEFVTGFARATRPRDLARIRSAHAAQVAGSTAHRILVPLRPDGYMTHVQVSLETDLPFTRIDVVNTDVLWQTEVFELVPTDDGFEETVSLLGDPIRYEAGRFYVERWNYGVFGPDPEGVVRFEDDLMVVAPALYRDGAGHRGFASTTGSVTVFRDGELVAREDLPITEVAVPPEEGRYRVEIEAVRPGSAPLSARTSVAWEFRSGPVPDGSRVEPTPVVRFSPPLAPDNTAPAGRPLLVPVSVDLPPGAGSGRPGSLRVEVSYDDGQTWEPAPLIADRFVRLRHPPEAGFVSLRATAAGTDGGAVEQTIIRAYEIR